MTFNIIQGRRKSYYSMDYIRFTLVVLWNYVSVLHRFRVDLGPTGQKSWFKKYQIVYYLAPNVDDDPVRILKRIVL